MRRLLGKSSRRGWWTASLEVPRKFTFVKSYPELCSSHKEYLHCSHGPCVWMVHCSSPLRLQPLSPLTEPWASLQFNFASLNGDYRSPGPPTVKSNAYCQVLFSIQYPKPYPKHALLSRSGTKIPSTGKPREKSSLPGASGVLWQTKRGTCKAYIQKAFLYHWKRPCNHSVSSDREYWQGIVRATKQVSCVIVLERFRKYNSSTLKRKD